MSPVEQFKKVIHTLATNWRERLGLWPKEWERELRAKAPFLWAHAASVGEATLTLSLLGELRQKVPWPFLVTTVTPQGLEVASRGADLAIPAPLDLRPVVRRFFDEIRPRGLLVAETELWPNLLGEARRRGVPTVLFNGRISRKSFRRFMAFKPLFKRVLEGFTLILARSEEDAERLLHLGAPAERVKVTGELKLYHPRGSPSPPTTLREELGLTEGHRLIVAGSTHPGEEEVVLRAFKELKGKFPDLRLLLAPRHVRRADDVQSLAQKEGFTTTKRSSGGRGWDVMVLDTTGELKDLYALASVAFVGGSLIRGVGGHNLLEPLAHGKVVLFGPHVENFAPVADKVLQSGAGIQVKDGCHLEAIIEDLLTNPNKAKAMGERGRHLMEEGERAMRMTVDSILEVLPCTPGITP